MGYYYMEFPFDRLERIPRNPAEEYHRNYQIEYQFRFLSWVSKLDNPQRDIEGCFVEALARLQESGAWKLHSDLPQKPVYPAAMRHIGPIEFKHVVGPWTAINIPAVKKAQDVLTDVRKDANQLLAILILMTKRMYGTENPWAGWPSLLRAAARGWALAITKVKLGSLSSAIPGVSATILFYMKGKVADNPNISCPLVITTLLKDLFIDRQVELVENPMAYESAETMRLLPPKDEGDYMDEWEGMTDDLINDLYPLHLCCKIMFDQYGLDWV